MARGEQAYVRALERRLVEASGRHGPMSQRDYETAVRWYAAGVPLGLVEEILQERCAAGRQTGTLSRCVSEVEEAWAVIRAGRSRFHGAAAPPAVVPTRERWTLAVDALAYPELRERLLALLARLDAGEASAPLERELDRLLAAWLPAAERQKVEQAVERRLAPFSQRMTRERREETRRRALGARIRVRLGLPRFLATR